MSRPRIVIVGADFAGYRTARTLARLARNKADITLLNPTDYATARLTGTRTIRHLHARRREARSRRARLRHRAAPSRDARPRSGPGCARESAVTAGLAVTAARATGAAVEPGPEDPSKPAKGLGGES